MPHRAACAYRFIVLRANFYALAGGEGPKGFGLNMSLNRLFPLMQSTRAITMLTIRGIREKARSSCMNERITSNIFSEVFSSNEPSSKKLMFLTSC